MLEAKMTPDAPICDDCFDAVELEGTAIRVQGTIE